MAQETLEISKISDFQARLTTAAVRLRASVQEAYRRARTLHKPVLAWASVPIPGIDPLAVFSSRGSHDDNRMIFLRPEDRFGIAGIGAAWTFMCDGSDRFASADEAWRTTSGHAVGDAGEGPVAFYGFAFEDTGGGWDGYPAGLLVAPRVAVLTDGDRTRLILSAFVNPGDPAPAAAEATIECLTASLGSVDLQARGFEIESAVPLRIVGEFPAQDAWKRSVAETAAAVRAGRLRKAVLARGIEVRGGRIDAASALETLRREYPGCTIFAAGRGAKCFLGASPERLVRVRGGEVFVEALAGSAPRGETEVLDRRLADGLLRSEKDRIEHAAVVDALRDALDGIADDVANGHAPRLLTVRNTHHLYTPLRARLRERRSVLDLIGRLHPTPAVGGVPRDAALAWIRRHEGWDRGWYAGPVGWTSGAAGEGEAAVAIRCALLEPDRARLFAGCGIVADSDPEQEFAESDWKLRPLLSALSATAMRDESAAPDESATSVHRA